MISDLGNNYKYFIVSMKEYFDAEYYKLENRRFDSIIYLLEEYLKLDEEMKKNISDGGKLGRSRKALLNNIIFYFENSPFKSNSIFKRDIESLLKIFSKSKVDNENNNNNTDNDKKNEGKKAIATERVENDIFYSISALNKKISRINILDYWISIILDETNCFDDIDKVMECYIDELLYKGYSLKYLSEWWRATFKFKGIFEATDDSELKQMVEKFKILSNYQDKMYKIILKFNLPNKIKNELKEKNEISLSNIRYELLSDKHKEELIENNPKNKKFFESNKVEYCLVEIKDCDKYRAIEKVAYPLQQYSEIYKIIDKTISNVDISTYLIEEDGKFVEKYLSTISGYLRELNDREREDIEDFIILRDNLRNNNFYNNSIYDVESAINLIYNTTEITIENKLLNNWTCVENLVKSYSGNSIIDKVNNIIPKVICMYIIKQKMNILWERLYPLLNKKISDEKLILCKSFEKSNKYNSEIFANYLMSEDAENLYKNIEYVSIKNGISELNKYISQPQNLIKYIETVEESIINSINSIYRTRNNLVHNGGVLEDYTQHKIHTLQYYLNCLLGTMIFHIKRNPNLTITEILYSIDHSYNTYKNELKSLKTEIENTKKRKENKDKDKSQIKEIVNNIIIESDIKKIFYVNYLYI